VSVWIILGILILLALALVLVPLLFRARKVPGRGEYDLAIFKDQLREVDKDLERGVLDKEQAEAARVEISRKILKAGAGLEKNGDNATAAAAKSRMLILAGSLLMVPVIAIGGYMMLGSPGIQGLPYASRIRDKNNNMNLDILVARVETHLRKNPDDVRGWTVIAPSYMRLNRFADAANAYQELMRLQGQSATLLANFGEAATLANNGVINENARKAFEAARRRDPTRPKPQYFLGLAALQSGKPKEAVERWQAMLASAPGDAPWRPQVETMIRKAGGKVAARAAKLPPLPAPAKSAAAPKGPTREQMRDAANMSARDRQAMIEGMVTQLAERLEKDTKDLDGWLRLIRAYGVMGRKADAGKALTRVREIFKDQPEALARINKLDNGNN
jgi:cytochrome c-type biogenesis protein CcmH